MAEENELIVEPFSRKDIKKLAVEGVQEAYEKGEIVDHGTYVKANPELAGTEQDLTGLQVENTKFKVPQGTQVVANPTLAGTETTLNGLQVGDTKYKVGGGAKLYRHDIRIAFKQSAYNKVLVVFTLYSSDDYEYYTVTQIHRLIYGKHDNLATAMNVAGYAYQAEGSGKWELLYVAMAQYSYNNLVLYEPENVYTNTDQYSVEVYDGNDTRVTDVVTEA